MALRDLVNEMNYERQMNEAYSEIKWWNYIPKEKTKEPSKQEEKKDEV